MFTLVPASGLMRRGPILMVLFVAVLCACAPAGSGSPSRAGTGSGSVPPTERATSAVATMGVAAMSGAAGAGVQSANSGALIVGSAGASGVPAAGNNCSDAAKLIYTVDQDGRFSSFNPGATPPSFVDITSRLSCPAKADPFGIPQTPYSMSVDRNAIAWVLYTSGELFRVDTTHGACQSTAFQPNQSGFQLMGMGFVANDAMSDIDTLFVAGGAGPDTGGGARLGTVDLSTFTLTPSQPLSGWPELTGTGLAQLWGFYPDTTPPKVARINKQTGAEEVVYKLATLQGTPSAWAFAFWGGDFWLFLMRVDDADTTVYRVNGKTGAMSVALSGTGRRIVGAGVSTCAPVDLL